MRTLCPSVFLCTALAIVSGPATAAAQEISSPYSFVESRQDLGPFVGWLATGRGGADVGPKAGFVYGLQYTISVTGPLSIGVVGTYFPAERDVIDPSTEGAGPLVVGTEEIEILTIDGRLQLNLTGSRTWHNLMPFVLVGGGIAVDLTGDTGCTLNSTRADCRVLPRERFDFGNSFLVQAGIGTAWYSGGPLGARITLLDKIWNFETPEGFFDPGTDLDPVPPEDEWTNNFQLTVALTYWF